MRRPGSRLILPALCVLTSFAGAPLITAASQPPADRPTQSPFYCDREALSPAERTRHFDVLEPALIAKRQAVRELPDGYEIQFASDKQTFQDMAEFVEAERRCCPFFDIALRVTPEHGPLWVRFSGRAGTKQFIEADGAEWIRPVRSIAHS
jgi:hypothetical protein